MRHNNQCFDTNHRMTAGQEVWIDVTELPRRKKKEKNLILFVFPSVAQTRHMLKLSNIIAVTACQNEV